MITLRKCQRAILIVFLFFSNVLIASPDSSFVWTIETVSMGNCQDINSYAVLGDTVINERIYSKIYVTNDSVFILDNSLYYCALRDSMGRWNIIKNGNSNENILYDFTLLKGDSLIVYNAFMDSVKVFINSIDSVLIGEEYKKRMGIGETPNDYVWEYWIEDIGSTNGLIYPGTFIMDYGYNLRCTSFNGSLFKVFANDGLCGCYRTAVYNRNHENNIKIYPNPADDLLKIEMHKELKNCIVNIYEITGKLVFELEMNNSESEIELTSLSSGIYFILILNDNFIVMKDLIIVN